MVNISNIKKILYFEYAAFGYPYVTKLSIYPSTNYQLLFYAEPWG